LLTLQGLPSGYNPAGLTEMIVLGKMHSEKCVWEKCIWEKLNKKKLIASLKNIGI